MTLLMFVCLFVFLERGREGTSGGVGRERDRQNPKQDPTVSAEPDAELELMNQTMRS